jgi:Prokaryotic Cytochrome C oxidase subunit IV
MGMDAHEKRLALWWLLLVALTVISLEGASAIGSKRLFAVTALVIAFVKVRIVVREFMEVRAAPIMLRLVLDVWGAGICAALIIMIA